MVCKLVLICVAFSLLSAMAVGQCPGGRRPFNCFMNPCTGRECGDPNTNLMCRADYCKGCDDKAIYWVDSNENRVPCRNVNRNVNASG